MFKNIPFKYLLGFLVILLMLNFLAWGAVVQFNDLEGVYFLNVGQGDSQLIIIDKAIFLIDSGKDGRVIDNLERLLPFYNKKIDLVFISHPQMDHAGGIFELLKRYRIRFVVYNGDNSFLWKEIESQLKRRGINFLTLEQGDGVTYQNARFDVLWPALGEKLKNYNDNSLVIRLNWRRSLFLFSGDISWKVEREIRFLVGRVDVLKVAHHGSKNSSSLDFLNTARPKIAVIGVGKNSYGHPSSQVLERLKQVGSLILRTDQHGLIRIFAWDGKLKVFGFR